MKKLLCLVACSLFLFSGCGSTSYFEASGDYTELEADDKSASSRDASDDSSDMASTDISDKPSDEEALTIFVQVAGAVNSPGVYELPSTARVFEAINAAGGLLDTADDYDINQAKTLSDGEKIYVYTSDERQLAAGTNASVSGANSFSEATSSLVNINTASQEELKTLPGIGDSKASQIISYRDSNGGFTSIEDIKNVNGIGDSIFSQIQSLITV